MSTGEDIKALSDRLDEYISAHAREHELLGMALVLAREVSEKDLERTRQAMEKRLEGMNEFRAQLTDAAATYVTRTDLRSTSEKYDIRLGEMTKQYDGKFAELTRLVYMAAGVILFAASFGGLIIYLFKKG